MLTVYKKIKIRDQKEGEAKNIADKFSLSPVASRVVAARGFAANEDLKLFLNPSLREGLPQPDTLKNLDQACKLVSDTIQKGGGIAICCDFDVDGLSGGAQLKTFFDEIAVKNKVFVPDRFEDGYGLNLGMIETAAKEGYALLITVDFGTTNAKEIDKARELGLKTIVVDHHHVGDHNPGADVFINPNQEGCGFGNKILSASGLAWYFVVGMRKALKEAANVDARSYLDLACLGTICDMVPLVGANRVIAKRGLEILSTTTREGLIAIKKMVGVKDIASCHHISFGIGPRINAAGRMIHGDIVIELLTTKSAKRAEKIASRLDRLNKQRQETEERIKNRAKLHIERLGHLPFGLVLWDQSYHTGVIGIVAQRLVESFYRPSAVMGMDKEGIYKGSVRGISGFSVVEALAACSKSLMKFGGHEGAGGFAVSADKVEEFSEAFQAECETRLKKIENSPYVWADTEVDLSEIKVPLVKELQSFEPFGVGNASPQLMVRNLSIKEVAILKDSHIKVQFSDGSRSLVGFLWRQNEHPALKLGNKVNLVFKPDLNTYGGNTSIQANLQAIEEIKV
ncbi:MAG: single-stranded-DNA-specific exonuclease RecJ [bacterium]|nr:single-stranded-DNA-specific exonuclease RecJ [bacterium]